MTDTPEPKSDAVKAAIVRRPATGGSGVKPASQAVGNRLRQIKRRGK